MGATDAEILKDIKNHFQMDDRLAKANIDVNVENGIVKLSGHTPNSLARNAAIMDAWLEVE